MLTKKLTVPNKLSELTIGQYQKFNKVLGSNPDNDFLQKKTIEIFCGVELNQVDRYKYSSIVEVIEVLNKMFEQKPKHNLNFEHKGKEYGFIPELANMSFGEFVDLDLLMSDWDTMDQAMAVLYRKIKNKYKDNYTIEEYNSEKTDNMKEMPLDVALGAIFFLENLNKELMNHILVYLQKQEKTMPPQLKQSFTKIMDGGFLSGLYPTQI